MMTEKFDTEKQRRAGMSEDKIALMQLLKRTLRECAYACAELIADAVIADGWVKPVCRVGDTSREEAEKALKAKGAESHDT